MLAHLRDRSFGRTQASEQRQHESVLLKVPATLAYRELMCRTVSAVGKLYLQAAGPQRGSAARRFANELMSAVGEAFNNVVLHAYRGSGQGTVELKLSCSESHITVQMRDNGAPFDFDAVPELNLDKPHEQGMGVHIIRSFVDSVEYRPGPPNILVLTKRVASPKSGTVSAR
jgi:anti-sigma regulatory factor (Ser/Thr protein kinase)